ncbi:MULTISPECIES: divergent PAP2 family protein [Romboutsia]|uniref:Acid phosphatase/vanadium-dependent haloperoxidase n=1 Tax=Romboutsia hominis TaxID=1507512 RepID=A0A2P2BTN2_9FIRM|nr:MULTISPECIES: divergent PAP2 family protein [Romboutsia]MCH1960959.1 divergent PAP2 family protein [Romboutsia hominis]MCH1968606.1 divergent PAP2 family protein [Romboutsia hominis]MDB8789739.1 divergent PAP2 family protein [Romboutsia sp. 1001216sp1]MDB8792922.1 divergent PAP2 family protein [Romboutsia sp. 1001216sp1]MDB8795276.1 divergent PAP2 family protein [Romboutsia sp. 1001216sp1]
MDFFSQIFSNKVLGISIFACFLAQFIKIFTGKDKRIEISRLFTSGGMPSSHSSFVTSLSTLVGIERGFQSTDFAIVCVFSLIIMYDATGVRRSVGKQAAILNQIIDDVQHRKPIKHERLKELVGHTPKEVLFGAILGILVALYFV